jgi:hypothetical protein
MLLQVRPADTGSVSLSQVVTEEQLVEQSEAFENAVAGHDRAALQVGLFTIGFGFFAPWFVWVL